MFNQDNPSENLDVLLRKLRSEHQEGHIYRGQTKYYEISVPSGLRPFVKEKSSDGWVSLHGTSEMELAKNHDYEEERLGIKNALARSFNRGLTNLLAQQYGLSSDIFDVTSSIDIAAFFATRSSPAYTVFEPSKPDELGVIYRMLCRPKRPSLRQFEELTEHMYLPKEDGEKYIFQNVKTLSSEGQRLVAAIGFGPTVADEFPSGHRIADLFKMPFYCHPSMVRDFTIEKLTELGFDELVGDNKEYGSVDDAYDSSRNAKQHGGTYSPRLRYQGVVPDPLSYVPRFDHARWRDARPDIAINGGLKAVFDINNDPNFERFFFVHDPSTAPRIGDLDEIWPPQDADALFDTLCGAVDRYFLERKGIKFFDPLLILDRGYSLS